MFFTNFRLRLVLFIVWINIALVTQAGEHRQAGRLFSGTRISGTDISGTGISAGTGIVSSEQPATKWEEALVTGNGRMGVMVFGRPEDERVIFNHERLYEPLYDSPVAPPDVAHALPELRRQLLAGEYVKARSSFAKQARAAGFDQLLWTDPYHPACAMRILQPSKSECRDYRRQIDFSTGEIGVRWRSRDGAQSHKTFVSRAMDVIVQQIRAIGGSPTQGIIALVHQDRRTPEQQTLSYLPPTIETSDQQISFRLKYRKSQRGYFVVTRVVAKEGETNTFESDSLSFKAEELLLLTRVVSVEDWADVDKRFHETVTSLATLPTDYEQLLAEHTRRQRELFPSVELDLGGGKLRSASNEALLAAQMADDKRIVPALLERMFDMGRYSLHSSSGEWPPNLMGIFNGDWRPRWSGDFTLDANVNLQIAAANIGNVPAAMEGYTHLVRGIADDWRVNAKNLFGCRGIVSGTRSDGRHNLHTHHTLGDKKPNAFPGFFWTAGAQWMILPMWERYQVTGDREYARYKLLPLMKDLIDFYEDFLVERDDSGKFIFVPSYSPENRPGNSPSPVVMNATMDIACAKEACTNLAQLCRDLEIEPDTIARCEKLCAQLPDYLINEDGALKEWAWPSLTDRYNHRHVSHLYPVWPGHEINPEETPELFQAAKVAAHKRGRGNGSAHGLAHMALIGTRLKDAQLVYGNLLFMLRGNYILPSLFTYHNPQRIYNADMLHSLPAVLLEMLVYSKPGEIELLPALDERLAAGSLRGAWCRGQIRVDELVWNFPTRQVTVTLTSQIDQVVKLRLRRGIATSAADGQRLPVEQGTVTTVELKKEVPLHLSFSLAE